MQIMHVFTKNQANGHNARTSTTLHIFCCDHFYETYKRRRGDSWQDWQRGKDGDASEYSCRAETSQLRRDWAHKYYEEFQRRKLISYKVNRCLARYSPRTTTTNQQGKHILGQKWPFLKQTSSCHFQLHCFMSQTDLKFVKYFTQPDFWAKNFTQ